MAYAAVISLKHTINRLKIPINPQITKSADEELKSLVRTLKRLDDRSCRGIERSVINELDAKITEAVWKLEDVLEPYVLLYVRGKPPPDELVLELELDFHLFIKTANKLEEEYMKELENPLPKQEDDTAVSQLDDDFARKKSSTTVGISDLSHEIINELLGWQSELRTVSLVGMAGIGKSHLAAHICNHPRILQHFDSRLWVRVGPKDQTNTICFDIVAQIMSTRDVFKGKYERSLRDILQNSLRTRRYLIVLDDIWSTQVLDYFKELLPDYGKRSRFILTTRLQEVAQYYPKTQIHQVPFLSSEESWSLLWQNVFADEKYFPSQLEKAGRKIAENCEGLPLLILAVANILRGVDMTEEYWKKVAEKKTTTFTDAYGQIYNVLLLSYEYLPQHLKAFFLYMGVFPQSSEIPLSKLINMWAAEDFLEPSWQQTLEDVGMKCLLDLVSKSLAIVCKQSIDIKSCKVHSAYWHLCVTEARKSKFFHVLNKLTDVSIEKQRRLSVQNNILFGIKEGYDAISATTSSTTRSLLCTGEDHQYPVGICFNMMLLKVLHALTIRFYEFPEEVLKLLQLRYLSLTHNGELPSSINKLQQLRWLILRRHHNIILLNDSTFLPKEIWDMRELRHLQIMGSNLPNPSNGTELPKLFTLYVNAHSCTEHVFQGIPNLKKLGIKIELQPNAAETIRCLEHIGVLKRLESLKCVVVNPRPRSQVVVPPDHLSNLPWGLTKLSLNGLGHSWKDMTAITSLSFLKVLKLQCFAFQGSEWKVWAGNFWFLEFLQLEDIDLVHWTAQETQKTEYDTWTSYEYCFKSLRHLIVRHCYKLKMIPPQIGDSSTLERIEVDECSSSVVDSAHQIKKKRRSDLQLVINSSWN